MSNPIFPGILRGDIAAVRELASDPANLADRYDLHDDYGRFYKFLTPLMVAASVPGDRAEIVRILLAAGADPNSVSRGKVGTAFYAAGAGSFWPLDPDQDKDGLRGDYLERLRLLLAAKANPNIAADNGRSPMSEAAGSGDPERVAMLLAAGASPHASPSTEDALERLQRNIPDLSAKMLKRLAPKNPEGNSAFTIPLFRAAESGSAECVRLLLAAGANIRERDDRDRVALHCAANGDVARILLGEGLVPDDRDMWLDALRHDRIEVAELLLQNGLDPNGMKESWSLLHHTAFRLHLEGVRLLTRYGVDLSKRTKEGHSPLHGAAFSSGGDLEGPLDDQQATILALVELGFDVNERDGLGRTPLHEAADGDGCSPTAIRLLLKLGASPDPIDRIGVTPLMNVARQGHSEGTRLLVEAGASPDQVNAEGKSAIDLAVAHRDFNAKFLAEAIEEGDTEKIEWQEHRLGEAELTLKWLARPKLRGRRLSPPHLRMTFPPTG